MDRAIGKLCGVMAVVAGLSLTGCTDPGGHRMQIESLQDANAQLERDKAALEQQLADALRNNEAARRRLADLQKQLRDLQGSAGKRDGWYEQGPLAWTNLADNILFDSGKADLKPEGRRVLETVAQQIKERYGDRDLFIIGHTDTDPIRVTKNLWKDNLHLSQWRGRTVAMELMAQGIDARRVVAAGQGEWNPLAPNDTKANKQINRRVQIVAVKSVMEPAREAAAKEATGGGPE